MSLRKAVIIARGKLGLTYFAKYLSFSFYDRHKNLPTDMENFFGDTLVVNNISLGENMACGQTSAK